MKITKRQLRRIIKEERQIALDEKVNLFNRNVRHSLVRVLVAEGYATRRQQILLREFDIKALAGKGAAAFDDADTEEIEAAVMKNAKKLGKLGQIGIKGLRAFVKPIAGQAVSVAKELGLWGIKNVGPAVSGAIKFLGASGAGAYGGILDSIKGIQDAKEFRELAKNNPKQFKKMHSDYAAKFESIGLPVSTAAEAASYAGLSASDDGFEVLKQAADSAGSGVDVLVGQLNVFGHLVQYLDVAEKAMAKSGAGGDEKASANNSLPIAEAKASGRKTMKITKRQLKRIIREAMVDPMHGRPPETYVGVPHFEGSYVGNGTVPYEEWRALIPVMEQFLEIGEGDIYEPALQIMARTFTPPEMAKYGTGSLPYLPFVYADNVVNDLREKLRSQEYHKLVASGQIDAELTEEMIKAASLASSDRDNEYDDYRDY